VEVQLKPEEIAAYIGAAAWVPQIVAWIYRAVVKPNLRAIPNLTAEIGFTSLGPVFNVRMAFIVEKRDLIIDGIELVVRHEDGEEKMFRWAGLAETFSEITDSAGNKQIVSKDQTPIAIKAVKESVLDKFVPFKNRVSIWLMVSLLALWFHISIFLNRSHQMDLCLKCWRAKNTLQL
jgi:hypothetical protein